jgi:HD-GYP domain-containing protein (c-di-GMP phosphodiesterase class II)
MIEADTSSSHQALTHMIFRAQSSLSERLRQLHADLLQRVPMIDRIACALYDRDDDLLKTFINSTRTGTAIAQYEYRLADSQSLSELAKHGDFRVIDDLAQAIKPMNAHSKWVLDQGYRSSFTAPMYHNGAVLGFVFFDSLVPGTFTERVQRDVLMSVNLINMTISAEMSAIRSILASAKVARDFSDLRDFETGAHIERMARYSRLIAKATAGKFGLSDEFVEQLFLFAPLHDIGKIGIPDRILLKPGRLDPDERRLMETHVVKGVAIIEKIIGDFELKQLPGANVMKNIVLAHHEYLDGSGYPNGLKGEQVPIEARIVTVADIFDALISARPYKPAWTIETACEELGRMASQGKLDPDCVAVVNAHAAEFVAINARYQDAMPAGTSPLG